MLLHFLFSNTFVTKISIIKLSACDAKTMNICKLQNLYIHLRILRYIKYGQFISSFQSSFQQLISMLSIAYCLRINYFVY